ncbi:MAG: flavodoxin family protein [Erysipelotrichaceae bacterium]|nr:flavodoxin family protein [Erysipelotrichaceae bacterium]
MKVVVVNGSPHKKGCTARGLEEVVNVLEKEGIETVRFELGSAAIRGCLGCGACHRSGRCVHDDIVNQINAEFESAEGLLVGAPVYYAGINGSVRALLDRLFYSSHFSKTMKVGAAVVSSRRAGSTTALDEIYKYFGICGMPIATSTYWNEVHGFRAEDVEKDVEGLQTMRNLGRNMAFLIKAIKLGEKEFGAPEKEFGAHTSFPDGL